MAISKPVIGCFFALSCLGLASLLDTVGPSQEPIGTARGDRLDLAAPQSGSSFAAFASAGADGARTARPSLVQLFARSGETTLVRIDLGE